VGQLIFAIGGATVSYAEMFAGRLLYGSGAETMDVVQCAVLSYWFRGKELAFAFGVSYIAEFTGYMQAWIQAYYMNVFSDEPRKAVGYGLFIGFAMCCLSVIAALGIVRLQSRVP
jgi:hypothetical protein